MSHRVLSQFLLVKEHDLSTRDDCVERTLAFIGNYWNIQNGQQDHQNEQTRPNLIISVLSDKEPLSMNQRALKSIVYHLVTAADEAKGMQ